MATSPKPKDAPDAEAELTAASIPAEDIEAATENVAALTETPHRDARKMVYVYAKDTGDKLPNPVPETWLDGRFPNLSEIPSKKAGK